jgi:hypothetical protein
MGLLTVSLHMIKGCNRPFFASATFTALLFLLPLLSLSASGGGARAATGVHPDVEETKKELLKARDDADSALVSKLADAASRPAMEALLEVYDAMASI